MFFLFIFAKYWILIVLYLGNYFKFYIFILIVFSKLINQTDTLKIK